MGKEDYRAAAAIKAQQAQLEEADCVGAALNALEAAVAEERFAGGPRCWLSCSPCWRTSGC